LFRGLYINETRTGKRTFSFNVQADSIEIEKFKLSIKDKFNNEWIDYILIPLYKDVPEIKDFEIADGRSVIVSSAGVGSDTILLGSGNGDRIANPGESVVILIRDEDKLRRAKLSSSDKYLNPFGINLRMSDDWSTFDWVGASAKYSVSVISSECPDNHYIDLFAEYLLPDLSITDRSNNGPKYPMHIIKQGNVRIKIT
jgi:hypothetical protein